MSKEKSVVKSGSKTLLWSVIMSAPGPLVVGLGLFIGQSSTQLADFIRRSAELLGIIMAYLVYLATNKDGKCDLAQKEKLERNCIWEHPSPRSPSFLDLLPQRRWIQEGSEKSMKHEANSAYLVVVKNEGGFPNGPGGKEATCQRGDVGLIPWRRG